MHLLLLAYLLLAFFHFCYRRILMCVMWWDFIHLNVCFFLFSALSVCCSRFFSPLAWHILSTDCFSILSMFFIKYLIFLGIIAVHKQRTTYGWCLLRSIYFYYPKWPTLGAVRLEAFPCSRGFCSHCVFCSTPNHTWAVLEEISAASNTQIHNNSVTDGKHNKKYIE